jgi:hypothetical protein
MNMKRYSSHNQHGFAHLTVRAQPRPIDLACASGPRFCRQDFAMSTGHTKCLFAVPSMVVSSSEYSDVSCVETSRLSCLWLSPVFALGFLVS